MMSKFKKKIALLVCMCLMAVSVAGCMRVESDCTINADGTVVVSAAAGFEKVAFDSIASMGEGTSDDADMSQITSLPVKEIDGKQYYFQEESQTMTVEELQKQSETSIVSTDRFYISADTQSLSSLANQSGQQSQTDTENIDALANMITADMFDYFCVTVKLPEKITYTNGELVDDNTVKWTDINTTEYYAYCCENAESEFAKDKAAVQKNIQKKLNEISVTGIKSGKTYKKKATAYVSGSVKSIKLNGKDVALNKVTSGKNKDSYKVTSSKKGNNTLVVTALGGKKTTVKFKIKK
ncbi:MAG: hypothetical protein II243_07450 [Lachnospiraceae bacterium]|nr:hypothetical protein [Lachnospiraceae bacterium]